LPKKRVELFDQLILIISKKGQTQMLNQSLVLNMAEQILIIPIDEILYAQAQNSYTVFVEISGKTWSMSKPLRFFQAQLNDLGFFRIHRSYMVNVQHLRRFDKIEGLAYLINEQGIPYQKDHVKKLIQLSDE
jgi:two-component system LytT family response regulator